MDLTELSGIHSPTPLNENGLGALAATLPVPSYDRRALPQNMVHIGVGGFHRAHQAVYLDDLLSQSDKAEWAYCGVGMLPGDRAMRAALLPQDCLYTVLERSAETESARVIGSIVNYLYAPDEPERVLARLAAPECRIVSLTITEGGYYIHDGSGTFDDNHPDIIHDLAYPQQPRCAAGYLVEALERRRKAGIAPFTVMSCDNLQHNGDVARKMTLALAERRDPTLHDWIASNAAFPNSMVDRIVPATTDSVREELLSRYGIRDNWPVATEPFRQWIIEDCFSAGRPSWEHVGAMIVSDVTPYEKMKMRLLNGSHQALCYIGILLGYSLVHEAMCDSRIHSLVSRLMAREVAPLLRAPPEIDLDAYQGTLLSRFANPTIADQLLRIGTDGSARIPKFVLPSIREQLARNGPIDCLAFTVAAWIHVIALEPKEAGSAPLTDPLLQSLQCSARRGGADPRPVLAMREIFEPELAASERLQNTLGRYLELFRAQGPEQALEELLNERLQVKESRD